MLWSWSYVVTLWRRLPAIMERWVHRLSITMAQTSVVSNPTSNEDTPQYPVSRHEILPTTPSMSCSLFRYSFESSSAGGKTYIA